MLPDSAAAEQAAAVSGSGALVAAHRSGRAWLVCWGPPEPVLRASAGRTCLVVVGFCPATTGRLTELAAQVRTVADVDRVARALPGSFHLIASVDGRIRVQGGVTGLRRVVHAKVRGVPVAGDRADLLASLTGAGVDEDALAVRVVCGDAVPAPLGEQSLWQGVSAVPSDHYLLLDADRARAVRWWSAPEPALPLSEGAQVVRQALVEAMGHRPDRVSADMSGGLDSTSLCFLAAPHTPDLLTMRVAEAEVGNDDGVFADHAIRSLPGAEHLVLAQEDLPPLYTDPCRAIDADQPTACPRTDAQMRHLAGLLAERGYHWHVGGHGGDELFLPLHGYLHHLARRRPLVALRHLRGLMALGRWPLGATLRGLARPGTVRTWWRAQADELTGPPVSEWTPVLGWGLEPLRATACASPEAVATARAALRRTAEQAEPLAADPGQHQAVLALWSTTVGYQQLAALFAEQGVFLDMPYLDDAVFEAVLSVQVHERSTPWRYKALLSEAMRGILPDVIRHRDTKGDFSAESQTGLHHNMSAVQELFADSALVERGLVDRERLRRLLPESRTDPVAEIALEDLIACEAWLRAVTGNTPQATGQTTTTGS
ncbi:asparagine synthase-related protein [Actinosynnema sp. CS-041913]|uniref:asparagine synthase-related protein n=1 Tax=Actinosynnema sp. CS-041913 TaxID=3239917 RepID=UPI003D8CDA46